MPSSRRMLLAVVVAGLLTAAAWWIATGGEHSSGAANLGTSVPSEVLAAEPARGALAEPPKASSRSGAAAPEEPASAHAAATADEELELVGRVVDGRNRPVAGAEVEAWVGPARTFDYLLDDGYHREESRTAGTRTDADGAFALTLPAGRPHDLHVRAQELAEAVVPDVYAGQTVTVRLLAAASLSGLVTRAADKAPVAGARVLVTRTDSPNPAWEGRTDAGGHYAAEGLDPGTFDLKVIPEEERPTGTSLELKSGDRVVRDLEVVQGAAAAGEVRDKTTGRPIPGAEVSSWDFYAKIARADASGRYALGGLFDRSAVTLSARAAGYGRIELQVAPKEGEVVQADFELVPGRTARGRVIGPDGSPVEGAYVAALASGLANASGRANPVRGTDVVPAWTGADGRFVLANLRTDLPHSLFVRKAGFGAAAIEIGERESAGATIDLVDVVLSPAARLFGAVVTPDGVGVADVLIQLTTAGPRTTMTTLCSRTLTTDSEGRFRFADLAAGGYAMRVVADGFPILERVEVEIVEGESRTGFDVVVGAGRSIQGRVVDPWGLGVAGAEVWIPAPAGRSGLLARTRTRADGGFLISGLEAGRFEIHAVFRDAYGSPADPMELLAARADEVAAGARGVEIQLPRAAPIQGLVSTLEGRGVAGVWVVATDARGERIEAAVTDVAGRFRIKLAADARVELSVHSSRPDLGKRANPAAGEEPIPLGVVSGIRAGDTEVVILVP